MEIYINDRPSALPAAPAPMVAVRVIPAATAPAAPWAHQVQAPIQTILALASIGNKGTNGFTGTGVQTSDKGMDVRGVPPRGRPV